MNINTCIDCSIKNIARENALLDLTKKYSRLSSIDLFKIISEIVIIRDGKVFKTFTIKNNYDRMVDFYIRELEEKVFIQLDKFIKNIKL